MQDFKLWIGLEIAFHFRFISNNGTAAINPRMAFSKFFSELYDEGFAVMSEPPTSVFFSYHFKALF